MWARAYLYSSIVHSGVMNGVTTGIGGVKRRFAGAQRSSSTLRFRTDFILRTILTLEVRDDVRLSIPLLYVSTRLMKFN